MVWKSITVEECSRLVMSLGLQLGAVTASKGFYCNQTSSFKINHTSIAE